MDIAELQKIIEAASPADKLKLAAALNPGLGDMANQRAAAAQHQKIAAGQKAAMILLDQFNKNLTTVPMPPVPSDLAICQAFCSVFSGRTVT